MSRLYLRAQSVTGSNTMQWEGGGMKLPPSLVTAVAGGLGLTCVTKVQAVPTMCRYLGILSVTFKYQARDVFLQLAALDQAACNGAASR
ncbi:hypothetical protein Plec18170_000095 [Paecilomyces lecythidis]